MRFPWASGFEIGVARAFVSCFFERFEIPPGTIYTGPLCPREGSQIRKIARDLVPEILKIPPCPRKREEIRLGNLGHFGYFFEIECFVSVFIVDPHRARGHRDIFYQIYRVFPWASGRRKFVKNSALAAHANFHMIRTHFHGPEARGRFGPGTLQKGSPGLEGSFDAYIT